MPIVDIEAGGPRIIGAVQRRLASYNTIRMQCSHMGSSNQLELSDIEALNIHSR